MNHSMSSSSPLIVAEISGNHNGSLPRALDIVKAIADTGAQAVKIQTYTADTITLNVDSPAFRISDGHELWGSRKLYDLYQEAHTPWEWHEPIFELARDLGMLAFSTPFDETAVDFLESLDVPLYKIASLEIVDLPLISMVSSTGKPIIISVGTGTIVEVAEAVAAARAGGATDITLLACTSSYPALPDDANLRRMATMSEMFGVKSGLSDHTMGLGVSVAAAALGASVIEKHVTLSREDGGVDSAFSMEPSELAQLVQACDAAVRSLGRADAWATAAENESLRLRPSLYVAKSVRAGDIASPANVRSVRPGGGLPPKEIDKVHGMTFLEDTPAGTPVSWELFS
jgi:pseudaminic acid synthase